MIMRLTIELLSFLPADKSRLDPKSVCIICTLVFDIVWSIICIKFWYSYCAICSPQIYSEYCNLITTYFVVSLVIPSSSWAFCDKYGSLAMDHLKPALTMNIGFIYVFYCLVLSKYNIKKYQYDKCSWGVLWNTLSNAYFKFPLAPLTNVLVPVMWYFETYCKTVFPIDIGPSHASKTLCIIS